MPNGKLSKPVLASKAKDTAVVTLKSNGEETVIKEGIPKSPYDKHPAHSGAKFGMSLGLTKNMDNYESLRVDVWLTDEILEDETASDAYSRVKAILEQELENIVQEYC